MADDSVRVNWTLPVTNESRKRISEMPEDEKPEEYCASVVAALARHPEKNILATGSADLSIRIWDLFDRKESQRTALARTALGFARN